MNRLACCALLTGLCTGLLPAAACAQWLSWPPRAADATAANAPETANGTAYRGDLQTVEMQLQRQGDAVEIWVVNPLAGPVEVEIDTGNGAPVRRRLPASTRVQVSKIETGAAINAHMQAIPGPPDGRSQPFDYGLPVPESGLRIDQAEGGRLSHANAENRHAIDFAAPMGTPVRAARDGIVMQVEANHADHVAGATAQRGDRPNFVRVMHRDGSMALYAHLQQGGVTVRPGQEVGKGDVIGRVGNSGQSTAPHLHFVVQVNRGMRLESVPVAIDTSRGRLQTAHE